LWETDQSFGRQFTPVFKQVDRRRLLSENIHLLLPPGAKKWYEKAHHFLFFQVGVPPGRRK
jgi:hypothetical protein